MPDERIAIIRGGIHINPYLLGTYTPVGVAFSDKIDVLFHGLFFGHAFDTVPCVPLGTSLHLHGPRLGSLDVSNSGLIKR